MMVNFNEEDCVMKKIILLSATALLMSSNANALDLTSLAGKVKSVADEASAKIESVQNKSDEKSQEAQNSIMEKINELKEKIANWQASDNAESSEIQKAIADAKASIEKLMEQLKVLKASKSFDLKEKTLELVEGLFV